MLAITVFAAALAGWLGVTYGQKQKPPELNELMHRELNLTIDQEQKIAPIEKDLIANRHRLRDAMKRVNRQLAAALIRDHAYGPREKVIVEEFHGAMMELQEDSLKELMALRAILDPVQARHFDNIIAKSLTDTKP
jgi:hypothetical protein